MKFLDLFKVNNNIDERNVVGFLAMLVFILISLTEVILNIFGVDYTTNPLIYDSLFWIILGSFSISVVGNGAQSLLRGNNSRRSYRRPQEEEEERIQENLENLDEYRDEYRNER